MSERLGPDALPASIWVQMAEQSPELALIVDEDSRCWFASMTLQRVTGFAEADVIGQPLVELVHPDDRDRLEQAVVAITLDRREHPVVSLTARVCFAELTWHDLNLRVRRLSHEGRLWFLLTVRDETVQRHAEAALLRRTELEVLLGRIQQRFVHTTVDDADGSIRWALEEVARFLGADRGYVLAYDLGDRSESMTHEWHSLSTEPEIDGYQHISFDEVPISMVRSLRGEVVALTDPESLGVEWAADRAFMEANGIRSLLELPMVRDGLTMGSVGFDWLERSATWTSEDLTVLGVLGSTFSQLVARKDAEVALERTVADSQIRLATLLDNLPDPVIRIGSDGGIHYANPAAERILLDQRDGHWQLADGASDAIWACFPTAFETNETQTHSYEVTTAAGLRHMETRIVPEPGPDGRPESLLLVSTDLTERRQVQQDLEYDASHDPLTGLGNRTLFLTCLDGAAARFAESGPFAVLYLDLDRFKHTNDSLGHEAGDRLLIEVAARLESAVRPEDTVARLGGDEFVVLLESVSGIAEAEVVAERLQSSLLDPVLLDGERIYASASIGVAMSSDTATTPDALLRDADTAMYHAKGRGRARYELFDHALRAGAVALLLAESGLHQALDRGEFRVHLQPVVEPHTGRVVGAEALVRWQRPGFGLVQPAEFIPVAEDCGLIGRIDAWVLGEAVAQAARYRRERRDPDFYVSVNLSGAELADDRLPDMVGRTLAASGLPPDKLVLEVTESVYTDAVHSTLSSLQRLRSMSVRLALDDFGTGYSSLTYIKQYPFDILKVDRSFIKGMIVDRQDAGIVAGVLALARGLDLDAIAEGVESSALAGRLCTLGCPLGQGFTWSPPVVLAELIALPDVLVAV